MAKAMKLLKKQASKRTPHGSQDTSKANSSSIPGAIRFLSPLLPPGSLAYFDIRRAGKYWGLSIVCKICGKAPPAELLGTRRWRWLTAHAYVAHTESSNLLK